MKKLFLIILTAFFISGCATSTMYVAYTHQKMPAKPKDSSLKVFAVSDQPPITNPYRIIGKIEIHGYVSQGVNTLMLTEQAKNVARKKGADAIINASTQMIPYEGMYVVPEHYGNHRYHPARYIPYRDNLMSFTGEFIVFSTSKKETP